MRADTVAFWSFDELPSESVARVPGKFGYAWRPDRAAASARPEPRPREWVGPANPTDSRLNVGGADWTLECWLRLDAAAAAADEGVIFEIGGGAASPGSDSLITRFSVLPAENSFSFTSLLSAPAGVARRIEFPNPEGPPGGVAWLGAAMLGAGRRPLPRETWFHVALLHVAPTRELRLFIDGRHAATVVTAISALPHGEDAYVAIGRDGSGSRVLRGAMDELRISDRVVYGEEFAPPGSLRVGQKANDSAR